MTSFSAAINKSDIPCSSFTYKIVSPSLTAPAYYIDGLKVRSEPTSFSKDLGEFDFFIQACLTNWAYMPINCVVSPMASFNVVDPCLRTHILLNGSIPDNALVMYQTGVQIVQNFLTNKYFPDTESLRI